MLLSIKISIFKLRQSIKMIAVITGDIINSTEKASINWLKELKTVLNQYGSSPMKWEIYRGDSFQLKLPVEKAMLTAFHIKATIKQIKNKDVRMGIGIGMEEYVSEKLSESNGTAYQNSGLCFESLKKVIWLLNQMMPTLTSLLI